MTIFIDIPWASKKRTPNENPQGRTFKILGMRFTWNA